MFKVLHIIPGADAGGISTVVVNYYKYINKEKFHFDVALTTNMVGKNAEILKLLGARMFFLPQKSKGMKQFKNELSHLLAEEKYDAIHVHENETSYVALSVAKKMGVKYRFAHAHSTSPYISFKGEIRRLSGCLLNSYYSTKVIACGKFAGERIFGKHNMKKNKSIVLPNAIEINDFKFSIEMRNKTRESMELQDKFVIGMVGRLCEEKHQIHGLQIMRNIHERIPDAVLLIAGNGPEEDNLEEYINRYHMEKYVYLLGVKNNVKDLYQAFDMFLLPSLHEGFPVVAVEAMTSGLPMILSDTITKELDFFENLEYISLNNIDKWIETILRYYINRSSIEERINSFKKVKEHHLDIKDSVAELEKIYMDVTDK